MSLVGTLPWALLVRWNQRVLLTVPWAVMPMGIYLWLYWKYLSGAGWPRATAQARRTSLRANVLSGEIWGRSLLTGLLGLTTLLPLLRIMSRLVALPAESEPINVPDAMPFATVFLLLVMASIVAGVVEEAAFRGYMQGPIERRHGIVVAILTTGALFGLGHFTHHPAAVLTMLPVLCRCGGRVRWPRVRRRIRSCRRWCCTRAETCSRSRVSWSRAARNGSSRHPRSAARLEHGA